MHDLLATLRRPLRRMCLLGPKVGTHPNRIWLVDPPMFCRQGLTRSLDVHDNPSDLARSVHWNTFHTVGTIEARAHPSTDDLIVLVSPYASVKRHRVVVGGLSLMVGHLIAWHLLLILVSGDRVRRGITMTAPCGHRRETYEVDQYNLRLGGNRGILETLGISVTDLTPVAMLLLLHRQWSLGEWHRTRHSLTSTRRIGETCLYLILIKV